jgi:hypothetical protein
VPVDPILSALPALADLIATTGRGEAPVRAQVLSLPAQLAAAPTPVSVTGVVAESPIPGQLRIATAIGDVQLHTPTELPAGRTVTVITRPNMPTEVFLLTNAAPAAQPQAQPQGRPLATTQLPATPLPASPQAQPGRTPPLTQALTSSPTPPQTPGSTAPSFSLPSNPPPASQSAPANAAPSLTPATPAATDARGNPVPAQRPALPPAPTQHAPTLSPASLVATFDVAVMPERTTAAAYAAPATAAPPSDLLGLLTDLRRLVAARDPKAADRLLRRLPTPDRGGAVALLTLPVAARRGDLAVWLGREIAKIVEEDEPDDGKADLIERLTAALTQGAERLDDSGERTWRWRPLAMVDNGQFVPLQIGVAPERERTDPDAEGKRRPMRIFEFAVEAALSALGLTRVEATYHQRRLDLVVQCETPIEQDGREQIVAAVGRVCEEFGLGGSCRFEPYRAPPGATRPIKI